MDLMERNFIWCFVLLFVVGKICASDDYGTWHRTLTPLQSHACDNDNLEIQCSANTIISVHYVSYGSQKDNSHLCPGSTAPHPGECQSKRAIRVISDRCHKQRICRLQISPHTFGEDPCPGIRKYIEVMYKCRPEQFLNKIVCEDGQLHLLCPPGQGLTIFSASFGTTKAGAMECRQPEGVQPIDCQINHADETVRSICSGRQNCSMRADVRTFGNPHCLGTKYLKVAYNCIERKYLLPTARPSEETIQTTSYPAWAIGVDQSVPNNFRSREYGRSAVQPSDSSKLEMQSDEVPTNYKKETLSGNQELVGFMSKWVSAQKYMTGNRNKLILYISLSLGLGIVACVTVLSARCLIHRLESSRRNSKFTMTPETEEQFFSDSDLEQYDPPESLPPPPLPVANYTASMKRHDSVALPRAPIDNGIEHNHYFS